MRLDVEAQHHEVATAGQSEIDMRFDELVRMADNVLLYKYIIKNVAKKYNKTVTFMPKPLFADNGSGMHSTNSLWKGGEPLFSPATAMRPERARWRCRAIGGLLEARPGDLRVHQPDDQQLQAARAGLRGAGEPGVLAAESLGLVPHSDVQPEPEGEAGRVPCPDPSCNPYLAFAAMMMAALDGIQKRSIRASRSTRTSTICRRKSWPTCRRPPARSTRRSKRSRRITSSCSAATCSPRT